MSPIRYTETGRMAFGIQGFTVRMRENTDQNNSEYGHFSRSVYFKFNKKRTVNVDSGAKIFIEIHPGGLFDTTENMFLYGEYLTSFCVTSDVNSCPHFIQLTPAVKSSRDIFDIKNMHRQNK